MTTKYFRHLYREPYFTKYFLSAPQVNWIITSSNYKSNLYKQVREQCKILLDRVILLKMIENDKLQLPVQQNKLLVLMQLKGVLHYKLQVQEDCRNICNGVEGILKESKTCKQIILCK